MRDLIFLFLVSTGLTWACKDKNSNETTYANCCGTPPVSDSVALSSAVCDSVEQYARVYIPNLVVVSDDPNLEFSRYFMLFGNRCVLQVKEAKVTDLNGQQLFSKSNFQPNDPFFGWNGIRPDGSPYAGDFQYHFVVQFADNQEKTYDGTASVFQCGDTGFPLDKLPACFIPGANDGDGRADFSRAPDIKACVQ